MNQTSLSPQMPQPHTRPLQESAPQQDEKSLAALSAVHGQTFTSRLSWCFRTGIVAGLRTAIWLLAIIVPVKLAVTLLGWSGILGWIARPLEPVFRLVGLPAETVIAFVSGACMYVYSAIAAVAAVPMTDRQMTIFAMMVLICHNLPVEGTVQHKAGTPIWRITALRLVFALIAGLLLNWILPDGEGIARISQPAEPTADLASVLWNWLTSTVRLTGMVIAIVIGLMVLQRILREFGIMRMLARPLVPVLWLLGLPQRTAFLWIVANVLGLAYGSAVILEEVRSGELNKDDAQLLNRSVAICHSLLEDTLLFAAIGAWAFWITVPRLALAAAAVWLYRITHHLLTRAAQPPIAE